MSKWIVDIHGDIEGDYEIIEEYKEPKTGHWTERKMHKTTGFFLPTCSECGNIQPYTHHTFRWNYCPTCGAKMQEDDDI